MQANNHTTKEVINRSELILELAMQSDGLSEEDADRCVRTLIEMMVEALASDGRVEIRGFGSFCLHHRSPRTARNPRTGDSVEVGSKAVPHFKPGKALREAVNYGE